MFKTLTPSNETTDIVVNCHGDFLSIGGNGNRCSGYSERLKEGCKRKRSWTIQAEVFLWRGIFFWLEKKVPRLDSCRRDYPWRDAFSGYHSILIEAVRATCGCRKRQSCKLQKLTRHSSTHVVNSVASKLRLLSCFVGLSASFRSRFTRQVHLEFKADTVLEKYRR